MNDKSLDLSKLFNNGNLKKIIKEIKNLFLNYLLNVQYLSTFIQLELIGI